MKKLSPVKRYKRMSKRNKRLTLISILAISTLTVLGLFWLYDTFAIAPDEGDMTVQVIDDGKDNKDVSDKAKVRLYEVDIEDMDSDEIQDLELSDYDRVITDKYAKDVEYYLKANHLYWMEIKYEDQISWHRPVVGENVIDTVGLTESITLTTFDDNWNTTLIGNTELTYTAQITTDDKEGLKSTYLPDYDDNNVLWFNITLNRTAQESYAKIDDYYNRKYTSGTSLLIGVTCFIVEKGQYELVFAGGKTSTYTVESIRMGFGRYTNINYMGN